MKKLEIQLKHSDKVADDLQCAREEARVKNYSKLKNGILDKMQSPDFYEQYLIDNGQCLRTSKGKSVPIQNGIPDFTVYSTEALDEKEKQASYHDDEEINERFDEIVLRPYNFNRFHAKIWLKHLYKLCSQIEKISGKSFDSFSVLNCGCGGGFEAQFFAEQGAKVVGFDISQLRAEASATRFALNGLDGFFYRGDAAILPFKDDSFDLVIYHDSLHHVPIEEIPKAIKEARRVSKQYVILSEAHDSPIRMVMESLGKSISIEASGNYTFRFKKSLMQFWCRRFGMKLLLYSPSFMKREHRPKLYAIPVFGYLLYHFFLLIGFFLQPFGNEVLIVMEKIKDIEY